MAPGDAMAVSPKLLARIGGALYLIIIAIGMFGEAVARGQVIVTGNAAATAANLKSLQPLWRFGMAAEFLLLICAVVLTLVLFVLLRPVSRNLALLAVFFNLVTIAVEAANDLHLIRALLPLGDAAYLRAFSPEQLQAMAMMEVRAFRYGFGCALLFFGCECILVGVLIWRSRFLPKAIGVLMQLAGGAYLVNSFALLLAPAVAGRLYPLILIPPFIGETSLCLWLLIKGVDPERWHAWRGTNA